MKQLLQEERILDIIRQHGKHKKSLLKILLSLQEQVPDGCIDHAMIRVVAQELDMTETKVYDTVRFYAMLKSKPQAKYVLKICNSAPCYFSKSDEVAVVLKQELGIDIGTSTADGMFAYHYIPCVGACDIGPIIKVGDQVYGNLDERKIKELIQKLRIQ